MYNRVILMGRLVADPEMRTTPSGVTMCRIRIAVDRNFVKQGEERQADFFDITCWRQQADFVCKYFNKGRMIHVEGTLQNNNYTDNNGVKHYSMAIQADRIDFCGDKRNDNGGGYGGGQPNYGGQQYGGNGGYNGGNSYGGGQYGGQPQYQAPQYQQNAPAPQRPAAPAPQAAFNQAPNPIESGDLGDFEEILSDGEVPF